MPPPEELDTWDDMEALLDAWYRSAEELTSEVDTLAEVVEEEKSEEVKEPLELVEASSDKLMDASVDEDEEVEKKLPELERESGALEFEDNKEGMRLEPAEPELALADVSSGRELEESPAEIDPELEADESRAVTLATATVARKRVWETFMGYREVWRWWRTRVLVVCRIGCKSDNGDLLARFVRLAVTATRDTHC